MQFIDTHAHIYLDQFRNDQSEIIERAKATGVSRIYLPNIDQSSIDAMLELESSYPGFCISMMGLHPCSVDKGYKKQLKIVEQWISKRSFAAIGEMGTDLYWDKSHFKEQIECFKIQAKWASELDLPIIIHCRDSIDETITLVRQILEKDTLKGIFHCFTGTLEQAEQITDLGFYLGMGGVSTFKNNGELNSVIDKIDLSHIVIETDSPYLAPTPYRGKRNEPSYIVEVAKKIAEVKNTTIDMVANATAKNAQLIFSDGKNEF